MRMLDEKSDNDVEVTWEDQQRINKFSRLHAMFSDLEDEIKARRTEREDLDDLSLELELREDERILYKIGDAYVNMTQSEAMAQLETDTRRAEQELSHLQERMDECEKGMEELKVLLYARFGNNISRWSLADLQTWSAKPPIPLRSFKTGFFLRVSHKVRLH